LVDHLDPSYRTVGLPNQRIANPRGFGFDLGVDVVHQRRLRCTQLDTCKGLSQLLARRPQQRRMERRGHGQGERTLGAERPGTLSAAARHAWRTVSWSSPRMAAMPPCPTGTASCIACARTRTRRSASATSNAPAIVSAVYSPRLWPATTAGAGPPASRHASQ